MNTIFKDIISSQIAKSNCAENKVKSKDILSLFTETGDKPDLTQRLSLCILELPCATWLVF